MAKIIVIDDDKTIQTVFEQFLIRKGHDVLVADDGRKGMQVIEEAEPDLVITDIMMPEMDGLEILLKIRQSRQDLPIIAISGGMRDLPINFLRQAKLFGAQEVFEKPVPLDVLGEAVDKALAGASA
ncbi:response regulator [Pontiella agarivorans]|uniref:Response regulator n=1 Tax=Pontiella agarivorans TaxID=3038953 RepID=A0ABU5MX24_9BACT|nr:response regulator [Pontiella agarivorans]MDZ8118725.1 response regulator [Pontiella agarivorans]